MKSREVLNPAQKRISSRSSTSAHWLLCSRLGIKSTAVIIWGLSSSHFYLVMSPKCKSGDAGDSGGYTKDGSALSEKGKGFYLMRKVGKIICGGCSELQKEQIYP